MRPVHISPFSGHWYPGDSAGLRDLITGRMAESRRRTGALLAADALGFVVPHASPVYSGAVAAAAYRSIEEQKPDRIIVLAFPHNGVFWGVGSPDVERIATPLGEVEIEHLFDPVPEEVVCDHSFEIQLPFLQTAAPQARIAPVYVGRATAAKLKETAARLAERWRPGTVFLASSDFTHYGGAFDYIPFPADQHTAARLQDLDFDCIDAAGSLDSALFGDCLREHRATVCGAAPIGLLLDTLRLLDSEGIYQSLLDYQTSGEITDDYRHSVSYAALGYYRREAFDLSAGDREALLDSASATLRRLRETGRREAVEARGGSPALETRRGVFVGLHRGEELLGCVGNCSGREPLAREAAELTLAAALDDGRFQPAAGAAGPIDIEISVLTPFRRIVTEESFRIGRHGGMLRLGPCSGLLLPQVAEDRGWTAADFLKVLARKSMLSASDWRNPKARLFVFEAQVFERKGDERTAAAG